MTNSRTCGGGAHGRSRSWCRRPRGAFSPVYRQSHDSRILAEERVRCKAVADAYLKGKSPNRKEDPFVTLDKVDYSPARNTVSLKWKPAYWDPAAPKGSVCKTCFRGRVYSLLRRREAKGDLHASWDVFLPRVWDYVDEKRIWARLNYKCSTVVCRRCLHPNWRSPSATYLDEKGNPIPASKRLPSGVVPGAPASQHK